MTLLIIFLLGAMSISFLCSILESVLMSTPLSYITMREDSEEENKKGSKAAKLFKKYKLDNARAIAAILSLNTIANTVGAAGVGHQVEAAFGNQWFGLVSAVTTILILIFSEIIPKTIGTSQWRHLMGFTAYTIRTLIFILYPIVVVVQWLTKLIAKKDDEETAVSREEVAAMADMGEDEGVIDEDENKIIQNVIKLNDIKAYDVMTPRVVAATAPEKMTLKDFYREDEYSHFSRTTGSGSGPDTCATCAPPRRRGGSSWPTAARTTWRSTRVGSGSACRGGSSRSSCARCPGPTARSSCTPIRKPCGAANRSSKPRKSRRTSAPCWKAGSSAARCRPTPPARRRKSPRRWSTGRAGPSDRRTALRCSSPNSA